MDLSQCKPATLDLINRLVAASAGGQSSDIAIEQRDKAMETVEEMKSLLHQVGKLGYSVDATLARKESAEMCFFRVMSMDDETVTMVEMCEGHDGPAHDVPLADLMDQYRVHKGKVTSMLKGWGPESNPCSPTSSAAFALEVSKAAVCLAMKTCYAKHECHVKHLQLLQHPTTVKVKQAFKNGELILPAASMKIEKKAGKASLDVGLNLFAAPHFAQPLEKSGEPNKSAWVVPFWLVDESSEPNMQMRHEEVDVMGMTVFVPVLVNKGPLKSGATLTWDKNAVPSIRSDKKGVASSKTADKAAKKAKAK